MLRIDVPVWFNAVCYMSVTVKGKTVKVLLLVFVEPSMIVVAFQARTGMELELRTRVGTGVNLPDMLRGWTAVVQRSPTPAVYRGALALQKRRELTINQFGTLYSAMPCFF